MVGLSFTFSPLPVSAVWISRLPKGVVWLTASFSTGARAAQVVPHVHFHIIPRPGDVPEIKNRSWTVFGKGQREELDEEEAEDLVKGMREQLALEIERVRLKEGEEGLRILMGEEGGQRGRETKL